MPSKQDYSRPKTITTTTTTAALPSSSATITSSSSSSSSLTSTARPLGNGSSRLYMEFYQNNSPHYYNPVINNANKDRTTNLFTATASTQNPHENQHYYLSSESMMDEHVGFLSSSAASATSAAQDDNTNVLMKMDFVPLQCPNVFDVHKNRMLVQQAIEEPDCGFVSSSGRDEEVRAAVAATAALVDRSDYRNDNNNDRLSIPMTVDAEDDEMSDDDDNEPVIDDNDFFGDTSISLSVRHPHLKKNRTRRPTVKSSMPKSLEESILESSESSSSSATSSLSSSTEAFPSPNHHEIIGDSDPFDQLTQHCPSQFNKNKMAISSSTISSSGSGVGGGGTGTILAGSTRYFGQNALTGNSFQREQRAKRNVNRSVSPSLNNAHQWPIGNEPIGDMVTTPQTATKTEPALPHRAQQSCASSGSGPGRRNAGSASSDADEETENDTFTGNSDLNKRNNNRHGVNGVHQQSHDKRQFGSVATATATTVTPLKKYATSAGLSGLLNIGNTCFMNSVLQCLSNTEPLLKYILQDEYAKELRTTSSPIGGLLMRTFADIVKKLWSDEGRDVVDTTPFKNQLQRFSSRFMGYSQQDAQEFLRYLLEGLHEDVKRVKTKPQNVPDIDDNLSDDLKSEASWSRYLKFEDSKIFDLFVGQLKSTLKCTHCGHRSVMFDPFWDLSLPVPYEAVKLRQCFEAFTREETLDGDEKPACSKCRQRQKCTKSFSIQKFPKILVIHLKRFSAHDKYRSKLDNTVEFPIENLDLSSFAALAGTNCTYDLYAVSNHMGSALFGHYTAFCRNPRTRTWHKFDDSRFPTRNNFNDPEDFHTDPTRATITTSVLQVFRIL